MCNRFLCAGLVAFLVALQAPAQIINTVAGGRNDNGLPAAHVGLGRANFVAVDAQGNIYVSDDVDCIVRRIDAASGISTVIAGSGEHALISGDGGPATAAGLAGLSGIAVDSAGNLYIADLFEVRRVDATTRVITLFAGGGAGFADGVPATSSSLTSAVGVAVDSAGNVYIADLGAGRVRKVDGSSRIITTVAGNGTAGYTGDGGPAIAAQLRFPSAVAVDSAGNLFIADTSNSVIRKVTAATGVITTIAGNNTQGFSGDGGPATAAMMRLPEGLAVDSSGNVWIPDFSLHRVRKVDAATNVINTVAGDGTRAFTGDGGPASAAEFNGPRGIAVDPAGNVYIADYYNQRVRKIDAVTKNISTVVGLDVVDHGDPLTVALSAPGGVAIASSGNIYIADSSNRRVRKIDAVTKTSTTYAGSDFSSASLLVSPQAMAVDSAENLYVIDSLLNRVLKIDAATQKVTPFAGTGDFGFAGDGGPATAATLSASGIAVDALGNVVIADTFNNRIRRVDHATGIIATIAGNGTTTDSGDNQDATLAGVGLPIGLAIDPGRNIYISESRGVIRRIDSSGVITTLVPSGLFSPLGLALDLDGNLLIADSNSYTIKKLNLTTKMISIIAGDSVPRFAGDGGPAAQASLDFPSSVAVSPSGAIYVADTNNQRIRVITNPRPRHRSVRK